MGSLDEAWAEELEGGDEDESGIRSCESAYASKLGLSNF